MSKTTNRFSPEVRQRAVRLVFDTDGQHASRWQAVVSIAAKIGCTPQTLKEWGKKAEVDSGRRAGIPTEMAEKSEPLSAIGPRTMANALERENRELRQANESLRKAYFAMADCRSCWPPDAGDRTEAEHGEQALPAARAVVGEIRPTAGKFQRPVLMIVVNPLFHSK